MMEWGTSYFATKGIDSPRLSVEWLLSELLGVGRLDLYLQFDRPLSSKELETMRDWVRRRAKHEPLQYITGFTDFYHCKIAVAPGVLIPRPETEYLVEIILKENAEDNLRVIDIGTGSGCIALALKKERPTWKLTAIDLSNEALAIAKENASLNQLEVECVHLDLMNLREHLRGRHFDIVVSNPPYVLPEEATSLDPQVKEYEPGMALFHEKPEDLYEEIALFAEQMHPPAQVYCEIHCDYGPRLLSHLDKPGRSIELLKDLSSKDRYVKIKMIDKSPN
jgi:release factor glutamine methyltransferase